MQISNCFNYRDAAFGSYNATVSLLTLSLGLVGFVCTNAFCEIRCASPLLPRQAGNIPPSSMFPMCDLRNRTTRWSIKLHLISSVICGIAFPLISCITRLVRNRNDGLISNYPNCELLLCCAVLIGATALKKMFIFHETASFSERANETLQTAEVVRDSVRLEIDLQKFICKSVVSCGAVTAFSTACLFSIAPRTYPR